MVSSIRSSIQQRIQQCSSLVNENEVIPDHTQDLCRSQV